MVFGSEVVRGELVSWELCQVWSRSAKRGTKYESSKEAAKLDAAMLPDIRCSGCAVRRQCSTAARVVPSSPHPLPAPIRRCTCKAGPTGALCGK